MGEDLPAQVAHHQLSRHLGDQGLAVLGNILGRDAGEEKQDNPLEALEVAREDVVVNRHLGQPRAELAGAGGEDDEAEGDEDPRPVGLEVEQQPPQQPRLERAVLDLLLPVQLGAHRASSSAASCWRWKRSA